MTEQKNLVKGSMQWVDKFSLFLFDLDGLLIDSEAVHFEAYRLALQHRGFDLLWDLDHYCSVAHRSSTALQERIGELFPTITRAEWPIFYEEKQRICSEMLAEGRVPLMKGAFELLTTLHEKGKKQVVVTNTRGAMTEKIKVHHPILQTIPHWITRECYQHPKPSPDSYQEAMRQFADFQDRVIGFEDSIRGVQALMQVRALPLLISSRQEVMTFAHNHNIACFPTLNDIVVFTDS